MQPQNEKSSAKDNLDQLIGLAIGELCATSKKQSIYVIDKVLGMCSGRISRTTISKRVDEILPT